MVPIPANTWDEVSLRRRFDGREERSCKQVLELVVFSLLWYCKQHNESAGREKTKFLAATEGRQQDRGNGGGSRVLFSCVSCFPSVSTRGAPVFLCMAWERNQCLRRVRSDSTR
ncbi:unnamed protein product, partial [Hapterophycus canaliculatus]